MKLKWPQLGTKEHTTLLSLKAMIKSEFLNY